ncbi:MAG: extracellular solute-binding protein [Clostridia bacterium]|nr:extracellular solute-binding protein [Clostridia bacterium]
MKMKRLVSLALVCVLAVTLLLTSACGKKPEPDTSKPTLPGDVSTDVGGNATGDVSGDTTGDSTTGDVSGDTTGSDVSGDSTTGDVSGSTTGNSGSGNKITQQTGNNKTTKPSDNKTTKPSDNKTTKPTGSGILVDNNKTTTSRTTTTTTERPMDKNVKDKILGMFTPAMKGKTATILIHFEAENDTPRLQQMYDETGVKIKFLICDLKDYGTRLSALINASAAPDIAYMTGNHWPSLVIKGFMQDLSATKQDTTMDIFDQDLMKAYTWNDKQYGVITKNSTEGHFQVTYYNKTIFNRKGVTDPGTLYKQGKWNWDTFLDCAKQVNDPNNGVWGCELYASHTFLCTSGMPIIEVGNGVINNNLDKQPIIDAWNFVNQLHHVDKVTTGLAGADENFATGKSVMMVGMNWMWGTVEPIGGTTKDDWGVVPAPCSPDITPVAISSSRAACFPVGSRNPDLGLAAYVYWCSNDVYKDPDDVEDQPANYPANEIQELTAALWDMPKIMDVSQGIVEYGGEYNEWDFSFDVFQAGMSGINTNINKWKSAIDVNIKRIMTEFS